MHTCKISTDRPNFRSILHKHIQVEDTNAKRVHSSFREQMKATTITAIMIEGRKCTLLCIWNVFVFSIPPATHTHTHTAIPSILYTFTVHNAHSLNYRQRFPVCVRPKNEVKEEEEEKTITQQNMNHHRRHNGNFVWHICTHIAYIHRHTRLLLVTLNY